MYDSTLTPPPLIPRNTRKHSRIGIASFVIGIVAVLIFCLAFQIDVSSLTVLALGILRWISSPILSLVGVGLGFGAVVQKNDKKLFGIIGLVINLLIILVFCVLVVIGMAGQSGSLGQ